MILECILCLGIVDEGSQVDPEPGSWVGVWVGLVYLAPLLHVVSFHAQA